MRNLVILLFLALYFFGCAEAPGEESSTDYELIFYSTDGTESSRLTYGSRSDLLEMADNINEILRAKGVTQVKAEVYLDAPDNRQEEE